jgi:excisionase family DNA binding protein
LPWGVLPRPRRRKLPSYWKAGELASALGVNRVTIHKWAHRGLLPFVQVGAHRRYPPDCLEAAMVLASRAALRKPSTKVDK